MKRSSLYSFGILFLSGWAASATPKNVLFIAVDDLRPELACFGVKGIQTPNIDRLAESGTLFQRAYCQQAVCGASRLSIMGGLYPTRTREHTFHVTDWRKRFPNLLTLNQHFGAQGYDTIGLGKIYHGSSGSGVDPKNWSRWISVTGAMYHDPKLMAQRKPGGSTKSGVKKSSKGPATESPDVADDQLVDGKRAAKAAEVLRELEKSDKPFFLAVGFTKPHLPFVAPKKYWDLYERATFSMPANTGIPPGYPAYAANLGAGELMAYTDVDGASPKAFSDEFNRRLLHGYAASVSYMDACVGTVLAALEETGLSSDTIVVFWGDHGWKLGDHSTWVKHTNFECDTRVPLIVRVPGKGAKQTSYRPVELIDLYPTLCALTGVPTPAHCQGKSFAGLLDDPKATHRTSAYSVYPSRGGSMGHSIRFQQYRYTEWRPKDGGDPIAAVLTDLKADPGEVTNVIADPDHAEGLKRARVLLAERRKAALKK